MLENEIKEVAANAAVENAAEAAVTNVAVEAAVVENTAEAVDLFALAFQKKAHQQQREVFGTHFGNTENPAKVKKRLEDMLEILPIWEKNLKALLQDFATKEAKAKVAKLCEGADGLTAEELNEAMAKLQAALAKKGN